MTDENMGEETLIEFPCAFTIKIMGNNTPAIRQEIQNIVKHHFPVWDLATTSYKESAKGNYLAITVTVYAENKKILDGFYREVSSHPDVKMVL